MGGYRIGFSLATFPDLGVSVWEPCFFPNPFHSWDVERDIVTQRRTAFLLIVHIDPDEVLSPLPWIWVTTSFAATVVTDWTAEGSEFECRWRQDFSPLQVFQIAPGTQPVSFPKGTGGYFPGVNRLEREADRSSPTSAEVKNKWIYTSTTPYVFTA
jgi:hypothetical protein